MLSALDVEPRKGATQMRTQSHWPLFIITLAAFVVPIALLMAYNFRYDPYQYYRVSTEREPKYTGVERYENPGLALHQNYDTIIIGTSRSQNFVPGMFSAASWNVLKLAMAGSSSYEQQRMAELALSTGKPRRVIWELSYNRFHSGPRAVSQSAAFPEFLYRPSLETPFSYLASLDVLVAAKKLASGDGAHRELATLNVWYPRHADKFGKNLYLDKGLHCDRFKNFKLPEPTLDAATEQAVALNLASVIARNPGVEFLGYLPPYPLTLFGVASPGDNAARLGFHKIVYDLKEKFKNFKLYDFSVLEEVTSRPERFKDYAHYDQAANAEMARLMTTGDDNFTRLSYRQATDLLEQQIRQVQTDRLPPCVLGGADNTPREIEGDRPAGFDQ